MSDPGGSMVSSRRASELLRWQCMHRLPSHENDPPGSSAGVAGCDVTGTDRDAAPAGGSGSAVADGRSTSPLAWHHHRSAARPACLGSEPHGGRPDAIWASETGARLVPG